MNNIYKCISINFSKNYNNCKKKLTDVINYILTDFIDNIISCYNAVSDTFCKYILIDHIITFTFFYFNNIINDTPQNINSEYIFV